MNSEPAKQDAYPLGVENARMLFRGPLFISAAVLIALIYGAIILFTVLHVWTRVFTSLRAALVLCGGFLALPPLDLWSRGALMYHPKKNVLLARGHLFTFLMALCIVVSAYLLLSFVGDLFVVSLDAALDSGYFLTVWDCLSPMLFLLPLIAAAFCFYALSRFYQNLAHPVNSRHGKRAYARRAGVLCLLAGVLTAVFPFAASWGTKSLSPELSRALNGTMLTAFDPPVPSAIGWLSVTLLLAFAVSCFLFFWRAASLEHECLKSVPRGKDGL